MTDTTTPTRVEDKWVEILEEEGVDPADARDLVMLVQVPARIVAGKPTDEELERSVERTLDHVDLTMWIDDPEEVTEVKVRLLDILGEGLAGERPGPLTTSSPAERGPSEWEEPTEAEPMTPTGSVLDQQGRQGSRQGVHAYDRGLGDDSVDSEPPERREIDWANVAEAKLQLRELLQEEEISLAELTAAIKELEQE